MNSQFQRLRDLAANLSEERPGPAGDYARGRNGALRDVLLILDGEPSSEPDCG